MKIQKNGMAISDFKTKNKVKNISFKSSCSFEIQPEYNIERSMNFLKINYEQLVTTNLLLYSNEKREVLRGFLLLPEKIDLTFIENPDSRHLDKKLCLHMSCLNITSRLINFIVKKLPNTFFRVILSDQTRTRFFLEQVRTKVVRAKI